MRISIISVAAIAAAAIAAAPLEASAQRRGSTTPIVTLNFDRVLAESTLGRDMNAKLQAIATEMAQQAQALQPEGQSIEQERQRLATQTRNMTAEQVRANANLNGQVEALAQRVQQFQGRQQALEAEFQCTRALAIRGVELQSTPVIRTVMESRGATVVMDSRSVQLGAEGIEVTQTVIDQLNQNAATRTATVSRRAVSDCQPAQSVPPGPAPAGQ